MDYSSVKKLSINNLQVIFVTITMFVSAFLMFSIQPLTGKTLLPMLGGVPTVWNTCMVFFQALLLLGYCYVDLLNKLRFFSVQAIVHLAIIGLTFYYLPIHFTLTDELPVGSSPVFWLLQNLVINVGAPIFLVCSTAPVLQMWFAKTNHPDAKDPYYLFTASNIGSMAALIAYPLLIERYISLKQQASYWSIGYLLLAAAILISILLFLKNQNVLANKATIIVADEQSGSKNKFIWVVSAFVPSSMLLGVTSYLTTDVTPVPLLWIISLGLYLLTLILAFAKRQLLSNNWLMLAHTVAIASFIFSYKFQLMSLSSKVFVNMLIFFTSALICHRVLVKRRPQTEYLPMFYVWLAFGGLLGGIFNTLVAPLLFVGNMEYPIALIIACLWRDLDSTTTKNFYHNVLDFVVPVLAGLGLWVFINIFAADLSYELKTLSFSLIFISMFCCKTPSLTKFIMMFMVLLLVPVNFH